MKTVAALLFMCIFSSCWLDQRESGLKVSEISYTDGSTVEYDSMYVREVRDARGALILNDKVVIMTGYVKPVGAGRLYTSIAEVIGVGSYIEFCMDDNRIFVTQNDGRVVVYRTKTASDYRSFDEWW